LDEEDTLKLPFPVIKVVLPVKGAPGRMRGLFWIWQSEIGVQEVTFKLDEPALSE
jgi:hypothetical protein